MSSSPVSIAPTSNSSGDAIPQLATDVLLGLCAAKLLLHSLTSVRHYGYFRDELYYLDLARHLDWGYVDCAPLIAVYAKLATWMGGSLTALRILPALAGTALVALSILMARELGGGRYAQLLSGVAILLCPGVLVMDSLMTMNAFEPLFWMGCTLVIIKILRTGDSRWWLWFGVIAGLGLENKHSTLSFGFAVTVALLLTEHRREFLKPWIWIAALIALALFLPNIIWQVRHHFPTIEDLGNVRREGKNVVLGPLAFIKQQIVVMHPVLFPIWFTGLCWLLWQRRWRLLGFTFLVFFLTMEIAHAKDYYVFPIYPLVFAGGAVAIDRYLSARRSWAKGVVIAIILVGTIPALPLATWMLSPERFLAYQAALGVKPQKAEVHHDGILPQPMGDQFGWPEMAKEVADIYNALPPDERAKTGIFAGNYGEAGALNLFGPKYGLPRALSRHQNLWYWPPTDSERYQNFIVVQWSREDVQDNCQSWQAFEHFSQYGMAEENTPIYFCRGARFDLQKIWWHSHHWN